MSRAKTADKTSEMPATAAAPAPSASSSESGGKIDRWLARSKTATSPISSQDESAAHAAPAPVESKPVVSSPPSGGVSACCNLFHLLDNAELAEVYNVLVSVMSNKGMSAGGAAQVSSSSGGSASSSDLDVILAQIKALSADAKQRTAKASSAASAASASTSSASSSPSAPVEGKSKLDRWAARAKAPAPAPAPAPVEGKSKLDRWAARAKAPASAPAPAGTAPASGAEMTPIETVKQVAVYLSICLCARAHVHLIFSSRCATSVLGPDGLPPGASSLHKLTLCYMNVPSAARQ